MTRIAAALVALILSPLAAQAQLTAASEGPIAMGHHHLLVTDVEAHKKFWGELLGGEVAKLGPADLVKFPNVLVFLRPGEPTGGSRGTSVNHVGFQVPDVKGLVAKLKAAGVPIVTRQEVSGGRATGDVFHSATQDVDLAFVLAPDDIKVELMQNKTLDKPIANHHIHFASPDVPAMKAWYAKMFDAVPGKRGEFEAADLPGVNLTFSPQDSVVGTKGRSLDHTGFEVKDLKALCDKLEAQGVKFDVPYRDIPAMGLKIAFLTDPWGSYLELTEGLDKL